jgi:plasmid stabilization system protein ParE
MTYRVILQPSAVRDIERAARWILDQSQSPSTALRSARSMRAKIDTLKTTPIRCPIDPDSEAFGEEVRVLLYGKRRGKYRVLFTIRGDVVYVLTIRHTAQQSLGEASDPHAADEDETGQLR